jgi:flagellar assembly factor FliW
MIVSSDILGPLEVPAEEILRFPTGLFGLPESRSFVLLPAVRKGMYWLQSAEHSALAFVLVDPFVFFDSYSAEVTPADLMELKATDPSEVAVLAIVTLPNSREEQPTANLQGPLALNLRAGLGKQLAMQDKDFGYRCPFDLL